MASQSWIGEREREKKKGKGHDLWDQVASMKLIGKESRMGRISSTRRIKDRDARLKRFIGGLVLARARKSPSFSSLTPGAIYRLGPKRRKKRTDTGGYSSRLGHSLDRKRSNSEEIVNGIE